MLPLRVALLASCASLALGVEPSPAPLAPGRPVTCTGWDAVIAKCTAWDCTTREVWSADKVAYCRSAMVCTGGMEVSAAAASS